MKIMAIPDIHMKLWMFDRADEIIRQEEPDVIVQLGDLPDDWNMELQAEAYHAFYYRAAIFRNAHPDILWCYGNHECSYLWDYNESGKAIGYVKFEATQLIQEFYRSIPDAQKAFLHYVDGILFSHAGLTNYFLKRSGIEIGPEEEVIPAVNALPPEQLWNDDSPIWVRTQRQEKPDRLYMDDRILQVAGHSPVRRIMQEKSLISCDVFSTNWVGQPLGSQEFLFIDSETGEWQGIR